MCRVGLDYAFKVEIHVEVINCQRYVIESCVLCSARPMLAGFGLPGNNWICCIWNGFQFSQGSRKLAEAGYLKSYHAAPGHCCTLKVRSNRRVAELGVFSLVS